PHAVVDGRDLSVLARRAVGLVVLDLEPTDGPGRAHLEPAELPDDPARFRLLAGDVSNRRPCRRGHLHRRAARVPARVLRGADGQPAYPQRVALRGGHAAVGELPGEGLRME